MIRRVIMQTVTETAVALGLPAERVMDKSKSDNLTLPRPRLELDFLSETYERTGRRLAVIRQGRKYTDKRELYEVNMPVAMMILASEEKWLETFSVELVAGLPRGLNDEAGNYVKIKATQGEWQGFQRARVGDAIIDPIPKRSRLIHLSAVWRVTRETEGRLLDGIKFNVRPEWPGRKP